MAVQDIRYYLNGLLMQVEGSQLRLVATDGHRLLYAACAIDADLLYDKVILPQNGAGTVQTVEQPRSDSNRAAGQAGARFQCNGTTIVSKAIDGKFPDFNRVIP